MIRPLAAPATPDGLRRRRHRFYRRLLFLCLLVMLSLAFPQTLRLAGSAGYFLITLFTTVELGGFLAGSVARDWGDRLYLALGGANLVAQLYWLLTPESRRLSGVPLLLITTLFIGWSLVRLLRTLGREPRVTRSVVVGAVAGYLLLGLSGGLVLSVLETIQPGSFLANTADGQAAIVRSHAGVPTSNHWELDFARINYFAFVSLTTTGYGDITPARPPARMASVVLGITGPLYIAVILGVLINRFKGPEGGASGD
ncbi:potassium channel family protein [Cyanobium gracile UHCC 0139]|uniref:Potassium channel family protein n=1 Tax=Cyanobium gracile UHCC 0139 TaxID=3110308 RepID=A0ABU5RWR8_9CYAN|nr:potassium channel family protein [Cyanobium gracile]MEA5392236.1 potassium channel family protein [Cyanobium gracile UHCC 0139]